MTEVERYVQPPTALQHMANQMPDALRVAQAIAVSNFAPPHFKNKPEECAIAILYGESVGLSPLESVQQIYVIASKPALYAKAMVAIVLQAGHELWVEEEGPGTVTVAGKRKGSEHVQRVTWTTEMAEQAGYTSNPMYRKDPKAMLYARASSDMARRIAPDALLGMSYSIEEMQLAPKLVTVVQESASPQDKVRAALGKSEPEADGDEPDEADAPADEPEQITRQQSRKLHATFTELGITERPARLAYESDVIGREITSSNQMTKAEASAVIEALVADVESKTGPPEPDPHEPVDAEIVEDDRDKLRAQVYEAAAAKGMDAWAVETKYAQVKEGQLISDATVEDLQGYLGWIEKLADPA